MMREEAVMSYTYIIPRLQSDERRIAQFESGTRKSADPHETTLLRRDGTIWPLENDISLRPFEISIVQHQVESAIFPEAKGRKPAPIQRQHVLGPGLFCNPNEGGIWEIHRRVGILVHRTDSGGESFGSKAIAHLGCAGLDKRNKTGRSILHAGEEIKRFGDHR